MKPVCLYNRGSRPHQFSWECLSERSDRSHPSNNASLWKKGGRFIGWTKVCLYNRGCCPHQFTWECLSERCNCSYPLNKADLLWERLQLSMRTCLKNWKLIKELISSFFMKGAGANCNKPPWQGYWIREAAAQLKDHSQRGSCPLKKNSLTLKKI